MYEAMSRIAAGAESDDGGVGGDVDEFVDHPDLEAALPGDVRRVGKSAIARGARRGALRVARHARSARCAGRFSSSTG